MGAAALESALGNSGIEAADLAIVVAAGMSRDYLPSWSVSTEIMKVTGVSPAAIGLDLTIGCLGTLAALNLVLGWLNVAGGGYGAVVAAERWAYTVDRSCAGMMPLWGHSDGAGALVVCAGPAADAVATFRGSAFVTSAEMNGRVLVKYGGTRFPEAPQGTDARLRTVGPLPAKEAAAKYIEGYLAALSALTKRFAFEPARLVCNQITPGVVTLLSQVAGVPSARTVVTGHEFGHLGSVDVIAGIDLLRRTGQIDGPVAVASSTPYAFGFGLISPP
jgi:3-oxoacyl-[acyl-carrier-protein] synthase III